MSTQAKILAFIGPILLVLLTAIAGFAYIQARLLSLPIPQGLAMMTVVLPLIAGLSIRTVQLIVNPTTAPNTSDAIRPTLSIMAILAGHLIYGTAIVTLSLIYLTPSNLQSCSLTEQWSNMFIRKDERGIRRIQDAFQCCGFNSAKHMPWPFPGGSVDVGECQRRLGTDRSCRESWRVALQRDSGLLLLVGIVVMILKVVAVITIFTSANSHMPRWMRGSHQFSRTMSPGEEEQGSRSITRRLIDTDRVTDVAQPVAEQRYEDHGGRRSRLEPSSLLGDQHLGSED